MAERFPAVVHYDGTARVQTVPPHVVERHFLRHVCAHVYTHDCTRVYTCPYTCLLHISQVPSSSSEYMAQLLLSLVQLGGLAILGNTSFNTHGTPTPREYSPVLQRAHLRTHARRQASFPPMSCVRVHVRTRVHAYMHACVRSCMCVSLCTCWISQWTYSDMACQTAHLLICIVQ